MQVTVVDHPLAAAALTALRDEGTGPAEFRRLVDVLTTLLAVTATSDVAVAPATVRTPVTQAQGVRLARPAPLVVPVLRAGLGMLDAVTRLLPEAEVGFVGMVRDETTLQPSTYAERLPEPLDGRACFLLDPMLATGGTLTAAVRLLLQRGAGVVTCLCLLAAPEGVARLERELAATTEDAEDAGRVTVVTASLDTGLTGAGYITPGLGDAGDRLYGTV